MEALQDFLEEECELYFDNIKEHAVKVTACHMMHISMGLFFLSPAYKRLPYCKYLWVLTKEQCLCKPCLDQCIRSSLKQFLFQVN